MEVGKSNLLSNEEQHHGWHLTVSGYSDAEGLAAAAAREHLLARC